MSFFEQSDYSSEALLGIPPEKTLVARLISSVRYKKKVTFKDSPKFGQIDVYERLLVQCYYKGQAYMVESSDLGVNLMSANSGMSKFLVGAFGTSMSFEAIVKLEFGGNARNMVYTLNDEGNCAVFEVKIKHRTNKDNVKTGAKIDGFGVADDDQKEALPPVDESLFYSMVEKYKMKDLGNGLYFMPEFEKKEDKKEAADSEIPV